MIALDRISSLARWIGAFRLFRDIRGVSAVEFALVLPETDADAALAVAERCRDAVVDEMIPHPQSKISSFLTVSLGVATLVPTDKDTTLAFIDTVDRLLYRAKQEGRNRVVAG